AMWCSQVKSALIAAVVAAVIASTTATAATIVVTSKNIKNGTIQLVDISARAKADLRGSRGPGGFGGGRGPQGPAGPGLVSTRYAITTGAIAPFSVGVLSVQCASGEIVISCGGSARAGLS